MANTFKSYINANITALTTVYAGPASTATTVIGLSLANTGTSLATASVSVVRAGTTVYVVKNAQVPLGDSLILFGGDQKLVIQTGDQLKVQSDQSVDVIVSLLEIA
jgi:3D (Asp-Asp-Asp) domain-containing protein